MNRNYRMFRNGMIIYLVALPTIIAGFVVSAYLGAVYNAQYSYYNLLNPIQLIELLIRPVMVLGILALIVLWLAERYIVGWSTIKFKDKMDVIIPEASKECVRVEYLDGKNKCLGHLPFVEATVSPHFPKKTKSIYFIPVGAVGCCGKA